MINPIKERIFQYEVAKVEILKIISSKIGKLSGNIDGKLDGIVNCMELMVSNQNKLISVMSTAGKQHILPPPFQQSSNLQQGYQQQPYFPPLPPFTTTRIMIDPLMITF